MAHLARPMILPIGSRVSVSFGSETKSLRLLGLQHGADGLREMIPFWGGDCPPKLLAPNNTNGCTEQCVWPKPAMAQADSA